MKTKLRRGLMVSAVVLLIIALGMALAGDVTVKEGGDLTVDGDLEVDGGLGWTSRPSGYFTNIMSNFVDVNGTMQALAVAAYGDSYVQGDLTVSDHLSVGTYLTVSDWAYVMGDVDVDGDLDVDYDVDVGDDLDVYDNLDVGGDLGVSTDGWVDGYLEVGLDLDLVGGKIYSNGGYDPPYVLYDRQSREQIIYRIKDEVPPVKQGGAALFFNPDSRKLEIYVATEGRFYDLQGNVVDVLPQVEVPSAKYKTLYYVAPSTGEVMARQRSVKDRYKVRKGFELNRTSGEFINEGTGESATREEALEFYAASEGSWYDLEGRFLRADVKEEDVEYVIEYDFDRLTGEVLARRKPVRDLYVIKKGFEFDKKTGEFKDRETGEVVDKEEAIELKKASEL